MKVKDLTQKIADFGTDPKVYIQRAGCILGGGKPYQIEENYGNCKVLSFMVPSKGNIKIFVE